MTTRLRTNKILTIIFAIIIVTAMILPFSASDTVYAAGTYDIADGNISINWDGSNWLVNGSPVANSESAPIIITGTHTTNNIIVDGGDSPTAVPVYIQINNLIIENPPPSPSIKIQGGADVYLSLVGDNYLGSGDYYAGSIIVMLNSAITISGSGTLTTGSYIGQNPWEYTGCGSITINSGTINTTEILGGNIAGPLSINGGNVTASNIIGHEASYITITGGNVTADHGIIGSDITITGGTVIVNSGGIGGGGYMGNYCSTITIKGNATVTAIGGNIPTLNGGLVGSAGIGGGYMGDGGTITIKDNATVTATGVDGGAGIGGGPGGAGGIITIQDNATVIATGSNLFIIDSPDFSGNGAGIGCGSTFSSPSTGETNITITGATVTAQAGSFDNPEFNVADDIGAGSKYSDRGNPGTLNIDGGALVTMKEFGASPSNSNFIGECVIIDNKTSVDYTNLTGTYYSLSVTGGTADFTTDSYRKAGIVKSGNLVTLTANASSGNMFDKWTYSTDVASCFAFNAGNSATSNPAVIVPSQTSIRPATFRLAFAATFVPTYTVTFDSRSGSYVSPITGILANNSITKPSSPTRDGYTFSGWYKDAAGTIPWDFATDTVNSDITLYAKWNSTQAAPKTGDTASSAMWILLLGIALVCMAAAVVLRKRNNLFVK